MFQLSFFLQITGNDSLEKMFLDIIQQLFAAEASSIERMFLTVVIMFVCVIHAQNSLTAYCL